MATPELPMELWEHIANNSVQQLYSVNRPLFYIALKQRYQVAIIDIFARRDVHRTLLNPYIRERAQRIVVCDSFEDGCCAHAACHLHYRDHAIRGRPLRTVGLILTKLHSLLRKEGQPCTAPVHIDHYFGQMMDVVQTMDYIREVKIKVASSHEDQYWRKLQLTNAILRVPFNRISRLDLNCPLENMHHILTADLVLPRLSTLDITFCTLDPPSDAAFSLLQVFLENHCGTVDSLQLNFSDIDIPSHFQLPKFPVLSRLALVYHTPTRTLSKDTASAMTRFISQHKSQLRSMSIFTRPHPFRHVPPHDTSKPTIADLALPNFPQLEDLTLGILPHAVVNGPKLTQCLQRYQHTLTSLQLFTEQCRHLEFRQAFSGLRLNLKRLALSTDCLCTRLLGCIAVCCPTLEDLVINVKESIALMDPGKRTYSPFFRDLPKTIEILRDWNLHSVILIPLSPLTKISIEDRKLVVSTLPRVRAFSEVTPAEYTTAEHDPGAVLKDVEHCWGAGFDLARIESTKTLDACYL